MDYFRDTMKKYLDIPSPSSFTKEAIETAREEFGTHFRNDQALLC